MSKSKPKPLQPLPILRASHAPQRRQHYEHLRTESEHVEFTQANPELFKCADDVPYGVFVMQDGSQILFDDSYRPIWKRPGERTIATRADPAEWFDWVWVYWLHDNWLHPIHNEHLRDMLLLIVEEFCSGGPLYVRQWKQPPKVQYAGELVARAPIPMRGQIIAFPNRDPE